MYCLALPQLPQYLCKKKKYTLTEPVKKVQWSKVSSVTLISITISNSIIFQINPYTIKKDSMWVHVDEEKYVNDELFSDIRKHFANKVLPSTMNVPLYF